MGKSRVGISETSLMPQPTLRENLQRAPANPLALATSDRLTGPFARPVKFLRVLFHFVKLLRHAVAMYPENFFPLSMRGPLFGI